jgi:predicted RNA-binding protein Jag
VDCEHFERLAQEAADRVKQTGNPETMSGMNSKERWVVHNYIRSVEGVTSISMGEGGDRRLEIRLA